MTAARHASIAIIGALFFVFGFASWLLAMTAIMIMGIVDGAFVTRLFAVLKQRDDVQWVFLLLMVPCCLHTVYFASRRHRAGMRPRHRSRMMPAHFAD
jgi:hypothetical protein